jgi:GntR family transcriptional regulator/MocR family aminotransferase
MPLPGWAGLYAWQIARASGMPLARQIYRQVRSAVLSRALGPGTALPSTRAMAARLGVARASVVAAYEQLAIEGHVEGRRGSGTFVAADLALMRRARHAGRPARRAPHLPAPARAFAEFERAVGPGEARPFHTGRTLFDARSRASWHRLANRAARSLGIDDLGYADPAGAIALRRSICEYLQAARAVRCAPEQIVITARYPAGPRHRHPRAVGTGR